VILKKLISHDWRTGDVQNEYDLADYKDRWGYVRLSPAPTSEKD
jgi:salicylate hydroxylase